MSLSIPFWSIILITLTEIPVELFWRDPNACSAWDSSRDLDQSWSQASFAVDQRVDPQVSLIFGSNVLTYPPGSYASSNAHHPHGAACEIVQASCSLKPPPSPERDKFRGALVPWLAFCCAYSRVRVQEHLMAYMTILLSGESASGHRPVSTRPVRRVAQNEWRHSRISLRCWTFSMDIEKYWKMDNLGVVAYMVTLSGFASCI